MLAQHPANLMLRFVLEVVSLIVVGQWGWYRSQGWPTAARLALTIGLPLVLAVLWAVFRTPEDPSGGPGARAEGERKGGHAIVAVPGKLRLALELAFFAFAVWTTFDRGQSALGLGLIFVLALHHIWSLNRLVWLWRQP
jgi:hypothetical protein